MWNPVDITALAVAVLGALAAGAVAVISALHARTAAGAARASAARAAATAAAVSRTAPGPFANPPTIGEAPSSGATIHTITDGIDPTGGASSKLYGVSPWVLARTFSHRGGDLVAAVKICSLGAGPWHEPGVEDDR